MLEALKPPTLVAMYFAAFVVARFENQRWARARQSGLRGARELAGAIVDLTFAVASIFSLGFLLPFAWLVGWQPALGLFLIGLVVSLVFGVIGGVLYGDSLIIWIAATLAIWPLMYLLVNESFLKGM